MQAEDVKTRLVSAYARHGHTVDIGDLKLLTGGSAAQTWKFVELVEGKALERILRIAHAGETFALGLNKALEAQAQNLAAQKGARVAPVVLMLEPQDQLGEGFVMPFIKGESIPQRILRKPDFSTARETMVRDCAKELALIHSASSEEASFLPELSAETQLDLMSEFYQSSDDLIPAFDYAFRWLSRNIPDRERITMVHGDFRNGNLLVDEAGLSCVMDWELAHRGDPMEDLGWLCVPSWRFGNLDKPVGGFGSRSELFETYEAFSGRRADPRIVRYWEIFGVLKWGVICLYQTYIHIRGVEKSINRAAIGRRVSETELDLIALFEMGV